MDEAHIIYVNSKRQDDTELGRLMHDLHCKNAKDMYSRILANRVYELKETQEGVKLMCHEMEQIYSQGIESGMQKGIQKGESRFAKLLQFLREGDRTDDIDRAIDDPAYREALYRQYHL